MRQGPAAVSCSPNVYRLGGAGFGFRLTGKLGCAWVGAWQGAWVVGNVGDVVEVYI